MRYILLLIILLIPCSLFAETRLEHCLPYKEKIESILIEEGVSTDYFYLAVCESTCKIKESNKGARGIFQLMPKTYRDYKPTNCTLKDIDDLTCNTIAASRYIKHLQERFHNMKTLVKAYNRGGTNLLRYGSTKEADNLSLCVMKYIKHK